MIKTLAKSIREYKKPSILAPVFVSGEVVMECIIPFILANLVNEIKDGITMPRLLAYGGTLVVMAALSLAFGALAGSVCATASCGFARTHSQDHRSGAGHCIAAGIDAFPARKTGGFLHDNAAPFLGFHSLGGGFNQGIGRSADSHNDALHVQHKP